MVHRRLILMLVTSAVLLGSTAQPALATRPPVSRPKPPTVAPPAPPAPPVRAPGAVPERRLTPQERAEAAAKEAAAELYVASVAGADSDLASLACVPNFSPQGGASETVGLSAVPTGGGSASDAGIMPMSCHTSVPQAYLPVEARDQINGFYCGPAVGQVIANYSWAMGPGANSYTQSQIAAWMGTDRKGSTSAADMVRGLERATAGSPRRPSDWAWVVTEVWDSDGDGWVGDQLYAYVRANISGSRMPLAFSVKPHDANAPNGAHLASWPNPVNSIGHWVAIYGWYRVHDGSDQARLYFTDSSRDEGGATGKFWTSTWWFTILILDHTRRIVW